MNSEILEGRSIGLGFSCKYQLTDLTVSVPRSGDLSPTVSGFEANDFRFGPNSLGKVDLLGFGGAYLCLIQIMTQPEIILLGFLIGDFLRLSPWSRGLGNAPGKIFGQFGSPL